MGRENLPEGSGLLIVPAYGGIHTFFMRFPIDAAYISSDLKVIAMNPRMVPWRIWRPKERDAFAVLELPAGVLERTGTGVGDQLVVTLIRWGP